MSCVSKENLRRLICEGRVCRASVCEVRGPYQRQCQYQTRHRKPGRIITDARQELPAARCPLPVAAIPHCPKLWRALPGAEKMRAGAGVWIVILSRNPKFQRWRGGPGSSR